MALHRTQLYLDETHYQFLAHWAQKKGASIASAVRDLIDERMRGATRLKKKKKDPFWKTVGIASGDGSRIAENYEDYLYDK